MSRFLVCVDDSKSSEKALEYALKNTPEGAQIDLYHGKMGTWDMPGKIGDAEKKNFASFPEMVQKFEDQCKASGVHFFFQKKKKTKILEFF